MFFNYMKDIQVSDFVKEQVQSKDYISRFSQWSTVWCGEKAYLFFMLDYNNYYIGAWIVFQTADTVEENYYKTCDRQEVYHK